MPYGDTERLPGSVARECGWLGGVCRKNVAWFVAIVFGVRLVAGPTGRGWSPRDRLPQVG